MTDHPTQRVAAGHIVTLTGAAVVVAAAFLPWARSGAATRNSFALLRVADDFGFMRGWTRRALLVAWFGMPALCGVLALASLSRRRWPGVVLAMTIALLAITMWWAALRSPLRLAYGASVNLGGATLLIVGALISSRARRDSDV